MTRGKKPKPTDGAAPRGWRGLIGFVLTLALVAGVVSGIKWLGDGARRGIGPRDRYAIRFGDIECDAPPGFKRRIFLAEVEYHSKFPATFQSLDQELTPRLSAAFAAHPWVAAVEDVSVEPPATVRVKLKFRVPALAVRIAGTSDMVRVVDSTGVLLPQAADASGLPELVTPILVPRTPSGKPWSDDTVNRAVELVEAHHPRKLEKTASGWRLTMNDGKTLVIEK